MSVLSKITIALALALALVASHWKAYVSGQVRERDAQAALDLAATYKDARIEINTANRIIGATHERAKTQSRITDDRIAVRSELERLRLDLAEARARANAQSPSGPACDTAAKDQLLGSMARDIAHLGEQGAKIAALADGHAADVILLQAQCSAAGR